MKRDRHQASDLRKWYHLVINVLLFHMLSSLHILLCLSIAKHRHAHQHLRQAFPPCSVMQACYEDITNAGYTLPASSQFRGKNESKGSSSPTFVSRVFRASTMLFPLLYPVRWQH